MSPGNEESAVNALNELLTADDRYDEVLVLIDQDDGCPNCGGDEED